MLVVIEELGDLSAVYGNASHVGRLIDLLLVQEIKHAKRWHSCNCISPKNEKLMLLLILMRDEDRVDAADDQLYHPWTQVQKPLVHFKDLNEVVTLRDFLLNADVATD